MYPYTQSNTFFHHLHPVTKFLLLMLMIALPFFTPGLPGIAAVFCCYFFLLLIAGGKRNLLRLWKLILIFWIFTFVIWIVIPQIRNTDWSYTLSAILATRIDAFVLAGLLFVTITRIEEFTFALTRIGVPYKAAFALTLGFRLVPFFYQNLQTIVDAQKSRGVDLDSAGLIKKAGLYLPIISILISYGLRNADIMAMALEAKGFGYSKQRSSFLQHSAGWKDALALIAWTSVIAVLIFSGRWN
jgi:energy-coupling factor transport system permease protein